MNAGDGEPGRGVRGERHVKRLGERHLVRHGGERPNVDRLAADHIESAGEFIHAFAMTTKIPDSTPLSATMIPAARMRGDGSRDPSAYR